MERATKIIFLALILITPISISTPQENTVLKLNGTTNWGDFIAAGAGRFTLENHPVWYAIGSTRADGKIFVLWTLRATQEACPGVYTVDAEGMLVGVWGYGHSTKIDEKGDLTGSVMADRVYNLKP